MVSNQVRLAPYDEAKEVGADWSQEKEDFLIGLMKELVISQGSNRVIGKFTKSEWGSMMQKCYAKWELKYSSKSFKNKYHQLKEIFKEFKQLVEGTSGLGWHRTLVTLDAPDLWWEEYIKMKHLNRLSYQGCPEHRDLEVIFGDKIATGHLQASVHHDFDSTDDETNQHEETTESPVVPLVNIVDTNNQSNQSTQSKSQPRGRKRSRRDDGGAELPEAVMMLAEASRARAEMGSKFTISECIGVLDAMDMMIPRPVYAKVVKLLQEKGWREAFMQMSAERRKDIVQSVEDGVL